MNRTAVLPLLLLFLFIACSKPSGENNNGIPEPPAPPPVTDNPYFSKDTTRRTRGLDGMTRAQYESLPQLDPGTLSSLPFNGKMTAYPEYFSLSVPVFSQRDAPASAAFATGLVARSYNYFTSIYPNTWTTQNGYLDTTKLFNPLFVYNQLPQSGRRNFYDIFSFLKTNGIANMLDMPFLYDRDTTKLPTDVAKTNALNYRIGEVYRLNEYNVDLIKKVVYEYDYPVVIGVTIDNAYERMAKACFRYVALSDTGSAKQLIWNRYMQPGDLSTNIQYDMQKSLLAMVISG